MKVKGKTKGKGFTVGIGIPYLPASVRWNKAEFISESVSEYLGSNRKKNETTNGRIISFKGKLFPLFKNTTEGFFSTITQNTGPVPAFLQTYKNGQYAYSFQRSYADKKDLQEVLDVLLQRTGLKGLLNVKISDDVDKVGSAEIRFAIKFKTAATNLLIAQAKSNNLEIFDRIGQGFISAYFRALNNKKDDVFKQCTGRSLKRCEEHSRKESAMAFYKLKKSLILMSSLDSETRKSREKLADAYTKFGEAMMENPFTLQTVLSMTLGQGGEAYLSVQTSKTKKFEAIMKGYPIK